MKISNNINEKLAHVPMEKRVFMYDATLIIEFLSATFMPPVYQLTKEALHRIGAGSTIKKEDMQDPEKFQNLFVSLYDMYVYYEKYRAFKGYTAPIESRYKFSLIIKKMLLPKNGWQFAVKRVGRAQLIYVGPCELRANVDASIRAMYPIGETKPEEVKINTRDLQETTVAESAQPLLADEVDPTLVT